MIRSVIAVAALVACPGAWAELDSRYWQTLGECSGLYLVGDSKSDSDGYMRIVDTRTEERQKLDNNDAFWAGLYFGKEESSTQLFYITERHYHPDTDSEAHRLKSIIEKGCERL